MQSVSRRQAVKLIGVGAAGAVFAACAPLAPTASPATGGAPPQAAAAPKTGGTLRLAIVGDLTTLDGHFSTPSGNSTIWQVYDTLISYDDKLQPQPELAESWDMSSDARQVKLNLRKGVQFHSGREFTSEDVKYNLLRLRDPKNAATTAKIAPQGAWWTSVDTPDKYTVVLNSDVPRPGVFDFLLFFNMLDRDTMEGPDSKVRAVGTGPFTFVEYVQGDHLRLARNKNYWRSGRPYLDGVEVTILRDPQAMVAQLEAGALDVADAPPVRDTARLKQDPKYAVALNYNRGLFYYLVANTTFKPLDNKQVRQALNYAIDRKRFTDTVLLGLASAPQDLPWAEQSPAFEAQKNATYAFDLDRARSLLTAAGVSNLELSLTYTLSNEAASFAQIYQSDLAKIDVKASLMQVDNAALNDMVAKLSFKGLIFSFGSQSHLLEAATSISGTRSFNFENNSAGFKDPRYGELINSAATQPDAAKRKQIYGQLNDYLLDQSFTMPLSLYPSTGLTTAKVHGLVLDMIPRYTLRDTWLE
jgi:peptide/nickel transport system substrate-binding protein